ncbi:MAG TPA: hypothetical protein PKE63_06440 [Lacibacter sp.]|nr:hypothetical protein [Lacibacter sp.]HMO87570.1 hypothetical protein [Lacibacter sp.]HMP86898.1 hypothetical protein [Lacibacter sp.]
MKHLVRAAFVIALSTGLSLPGKTQVLNKLKEKVNKAVDKAVEKKVNEAIGVPDNQPPANNPGSNNPTNKKGGGLKNTAPPDVQQQMQAADSSFKTGNYSDARYSIQQALTGVEIQLGKQILKSLPNKVTDLDRDTTRNVVYSNQWGFQNMTIQAVYKNTKEKQLTLTIGNNVYYSGVLNMYLFNPAFAQANNEEQNVKQVRVKGNKAIITYDDNKGYTLIVPLGQSASIVWECINFDSEEQVMAAANAFDIEGIKKMMGEK